MDEREHIDESADDDGEPTLVLLSLAVVKAALHRRRRFWIALGLAGLLLGASFQFLLPPKVQARTTLYLAVPKDSDPERAMKTDVNLLHTRAVAVMAIDKLGLKVTPDALLDTYSGDSPGNHVLTITVSGASAHEAVTRADAIASSFLQFLADQANEQTDATVAALQARLDMLQSEIKDVTAKIDKLTNAPSGGQSIELQDLISQRADATTENSQLQARIEDARLDAQALSNGSRVVDPATTAPAPGMRASLINGLAGLVVGLGLAVALVSVQAVTTDRLRRRRDIADALGVRLTLSTTRVRVPRLLRVRRLQRQVDAPTGALKVVVDHIADHLRSGRGRGPATMILSVDDPAVGAAITAASGLALARAGRRVLIGDLLERPLVERLVHADHRGFVPLTELPPGLPLGTTDIELIRSSRQELVGPVGSLTIARASLDEMHGPHWAAVPGPASMDEFDVILAVTVLDPARGARQLREWGDEATALVTAGRSTAASIGNTSEMLSEAGIVIRLAIVIGSDRTDDSLGTLPDERPSTTPLRQAFGSGVGPSR